jgi:glutaminase
MPIAAPVQQVLDELLERYRGVNDGAVATYIPGLATADPEWFGISVVALNGHRYSAGDTGVEFTIQSISKPFIYGLALEDHGEDFVLAKVGLEPTGDAFNAISLHPQSGRPSNPMINAGAIAVASLIGPAGTQTPDARMLAMFERYAGRSLHVDDEVYRSERDTGHRNRAISHLLRNFEIMTGEPEEALDLYFRQCSVAVTCADLAVIAACLANGGVNPITGERALDARYVERVLSVMGTCGMYDYAGEWIYRIGIPAKSGVSGGVLAVLPGQLGIGVFSPRLDPRGNSIRGVLVCGSLSSKYGLHMLKVPNAAAAAVRSSYDLSVTRSKRQRRPDAEAALAAGGARALVYELQGDLNFASAESFTRDVVERLDSFDAIAIDFKRVSRLDGGAVTLVSELMGGLIAASKLVVLADVEHHPGLCEAATALAAKNTCLVLAANRDQAIERCEDAVIEAAGVSAMAAAVPLASNAFFKGLKPTVAERLQVLAQPGFARAGERIARGGEPSAGIYLLLSGDASAIVDLPGGEYVRFATYPAGTAFGEAELVGDRLHDHDIVADTDVEFAEIPLAAIEVLAEADHALSAAIFRNIARRAVAQLQAAHAEIQALSS